MCGIVGFNFNDKLSLRKMIRTLRHRGPDQNGIYEDNGVSLGHARLSIIDLKNGKQPMSNEDESIWIVFNGEIFNHKELGNILKKKGHDFKTNCDTEVLIHGYEEEGLDFFKKLNGQFAFCIYDSNIKKMFLVRDRLGIKPLYYYNNEKENKFIFASEMKCILDCGVKVDLNEDVISDYVSYNYVPSPNSIFKEINKLEPSSILTFDLKESKLEKIEKYWDLSFKTKKISFSNAKRKVLSELKKAVDKRMIADVKVGCFLSGGIDSSTIVALASQENEVNTFSIGFEDGDDELELARKTSEMYNTKHKEFIVKADDFSILPKLMYYSDEPFADSSIIPSYFVCNEASKHVKVCLSGDGGDENFAGYDRYVKNKYEKIYSKVPIFNPRFERIRNIASIKDDTHRFVKGNENFIDSEKMQLLNKEFKKSFKMKFMLNSLDRLNNLLYNDIKTTLPESYLKKVDVASMSNSMEVRVPFLDHKFMEFSATLPSNFKNKLWMKKYILKKATKGLIPNSIIEGKKKGFDSPVGHWLKGNLKFKMEELFLSSAKRGHFDLRYLEKLWKEHQSNIRNNKERIFNIICFEIWNRIYVDGEKVNKVL